MLDSAGLVSLEGPSELVPKESLSEDKVAPRECIVCGTAFTNRADDPGLIKPCSGCDDDFRFACSGHSFALAIHGPDDLMPAKCCTLIQIHAILPGLTKEEGDTYRANSSSG